jgi:excinuclease ABC subunit A
MVAEPTADNKTLERSINTAVHHGENVLMILDQDSNEVRHLAENLA